MANRKKDPKEQVNFHIPQSLKRDVANLAAVLGITQSELAKQALRAHVAGHDIKTGRQVQLPSAGQQILHPEDLILFSDLVNCNAFVDDESLFQATNKDWTRKVWVNDVRCRCVHVNWIVSAYTGRGRDELLNDGWMSLFHRADQDQCVKNLQASFQDRRPFCNLYRMLRTDDFWGWVLDQGIPRYRNGEFAGYIGTFYEIAAPGTLPAPEFVAFQKNYSHAAHKRVASARVSLYPAHSLAV